MVVASMWSPSLVFGALLLALVASAAGAFAVATLVVTPSLRALEMAGKAVELAAIETERAANVTAFDLPRTLEDVSAASREWELLGRELREGGSGLLKAWYNTRKGSEDLVYGLTSGATNATIGGAEATIKAARNSLDALGGSLTSALDTFTRATVITRSREAAQALRAVRKEQEEQRALLESMSSGDYDRDENSDDESAKVLPLPKSSSSEAWRKSAWSIVSGNVDGNETATAKADAEGQQDVSPTKRKEESFDPVESALAAAEAAALAAADANERLDKALRRVRDL